jgi:hypothetical protein
MERVGPLAFADNTTPDLFTCPAGFKAEITEVVFNYGAGSGQLVIPYIRTPVAYTRIGLVVVSAPLTFTTVFSFDAVVIYAGEKLAVSVSNNGANWTAMATYVLVTNP